MNNRQFNKISERIKDLLSIVCELEKEFPDRKFTLDGHLIGSIGEVLASHYYGIDLFPSSYPLYDGIVDKKKVQIKITQGNSVDITGEPDYLIVLFLKKSEGKVYEVYNGTGKRALANSKKTESGCYNCSLKRLYNCNLETESDEKIVAINSIDTWNKGITN